MNIEIALDVNDPSRMMNFWAALLNYELAGEERFDTPERIYWSLIPRRGSGPRLVIQRVPEPTTSKSRFHLDLHVADIAAEAARAEGLGATRLDATPITEVGATWIRMLDPEGNVFCFVRAHPH